MIDRTGKAARITDPKTIPPISQPEYTEPAVVETPYPGYKVDGPTRANAGRLIAVHWVAAPSHSVLDWIGLYQVSSPDVPHPISAYVGKTTESGVLYLTLPADASGEWELRFFQNNTFTLMAKSLPFTVG